MRGLTGTLLLFVCLLAFVCSVSPPLPHPTDECPFMAIRESSSLLPVNA